MMLSKWIKNYHARCTEGIEDENKRFEMIRMNNQLLGALGVVPILLLVYIYYDIRSLQIASLLSASGYILLLVLQLYPRTRYISNYLFIPFALSSVCYVDNTLGEDAATYILYYLTFIEILVSIFNQRISVVISNIISMAFFVCISVYFKHNLFIDRSLSPQLIRIHWWINNGLFISSLAFYIYYSMLMRKKYEQFLVLEKQSRDKKEKHLRQEKLILEIQKQDAEYRILKNQLNPHFVFNTLETIKYLAKNDYARADKYINQLSDFLRISLKNESGAVTVEEELLMLDNYIHIQQLRLEGLFSFRKDISANIYSYKIPYFSLVTLVENAIKHNKMSLQQVLEIKIYNDDDYLYITNPIRKKNIIETSTGIGLKNLSERYRFLYQSDLEVIESDTMFCVKLKLIKS